MKNNRRDFLKKSALLGLTGLAGSILGKEKIEKFESFSSMLSSAGAFSLPPLPYAYDALEPFIDKETMVLHHDKHHQAYVDKLNKALENNSDNLGLPQLFGSVSTLDPAIRNNGGGHYNHSLFWILMKSKNTPEESMPQGKFGEALKLTFKSPELFRKEFTEAAMKIFGSGWCWLIVRDNELMITTTANQDNPLMDVAKDQGTPVLALDVWEHAYYLKYQNKRIDYINNWWNVVNWRRVEELYNDSLTK